MRWMKVSRRKTIKVMWLTIKRKIKVKKMTIRRRKMSQMMTRQPRHKKANLKIRELIRVISEQER